jgi:NADPH:quinone reductase-like Zn-dependent oxidoreductase
MRAVRFEQYGDVDVLELVDVPAPVPGAGRLLVRVKAAGINPGEDKIRHGLLHDRLAGDVPVGRGQ